MLRRHQTLTFAWVLGCQQGRNGIKIFVRRELNEEAAGSDRTEFETQLHLLASLRSCVKYLIFLGISLLSVLFEGCRKLHRLSRNDSSYESLGSWDWMCQVNQIVISGPFPTICLWLFLHLTEYLLFHMSCHYFDESTKVIRIKSKYIF